MYNIRVDFGLSEAVVLVNVIRTISVMILTLFMLLLSSAVFFLNKFFQKNLS